MFFNRFTPNKADRWIWSAHLCRALCLCIFCRQLFWIESSCIWIPRVLHSFCKNKINQMVIWTIIEKSLLSSYLPNWGSFCTNLSECGYLSKFELLSHNLTSMSLPLLPQGSLQMSVATQGPNLKGSVPVGVEAVQNITEYPPMLIGGKWCLRRGITYQRDQELFNNSEELTIAIAWQEIDVCDLFSFYETWTLGGMLGPEERGGRL